MDLKLTGKKALVTGSTAGIGFAIGLALAREGAEVILNGRTAERVEAAVGRVKQASEGHGHVTGIAADLATDRGAATVFERVPKVDILVNNLGIYEAKPFVEISDADWERIFRVNVLSGIRLTRHYFDGMRTRHWGRVVFISSESGVNIPAEMIHYGVTKTAQLAVARGLAELTKNSGVTVNSVLPGPTLSEGVETFVKDMARQTSKSEAEMEKDFFRTLRPTSLLQRFAGPEEVASLVAFVCSPLASAINGSALRVEGGLLRSIT
jgi:NAD(P)-dependent dehydrogenase (short-subunit alcohol dehydrogenase family)